jgi:hypothetical protein
MSHTQVAGARDGGTQVNAVSVEELFRLYARSGFLYPEKLRKLAPYIDLIRENWRRALRGGERVLMAFTHNDERGSGMSSISTWRSAKRGWVSQHLVSDSANPLSTRAVLLSAQRTKIERGDDDSQQNWFRPENRFPARVFGSVSASLGETRASLRSYSLFTTGGDSTTRSGVPAARIVKYDASHASALLWLASSGESPLFARAEELAEDPEFECVGEIYSSLGLRRGRSIWLAYEPNRIDPVAAVLAYRGPLGMNFSFLENRCHLLLDPSATTLGATNAALALLERARAAYADFEANEIPVVAPATCSAALSRAGLDFVRNYDQCIWVREGFEAWHAHVDGFYSRLISRAARKDVEEGVR